MDQPETGPLMSIAAVERETRIGKDTLRVWERRYGFPMPQRDANGERLYPAAQVDRLRTVKRLLDAGHRPGRVVPLAPAALASLEQALGAGSPAEPAPSGGEGAGAPGDAVAALIALLHTHDALQLRRALSQALLRQGLARFVADTAVPLVHRIGQGWAAGWITVHEEHLASDVIETVLRAALASAPDPLPQGRPRVLLTTLQGEAHGLGLLMAAALFSVEGCAVTSLGCQTPSRDIAEAAAATAADIVALSASAATPPSALAAALGELRALLPAGVALWAGTPHALRRVPQGVTVLDRLDAIGTRLAAWRAAA